MKKSLKGLATGIGSLPYKDAAQALEMVFKYMPDAPFWPQLPKRNLKEGMIAQFIRNIPCLEFSGQSPVFNPAKKEEKLEAFYERIIANDYEYFAIGEDFSQGFYAYIKYLQKNGPQNAQFLKCHITGPFTFAASVKDEKGVILLHDQVFMQVIAKALAMKALWQIKELEKFGRKVMIFLDEPYLGCFGSAYTPINRQDVVGQLQEFLEPLVSDNVRIGVHCCGNTDWSIFSDVKQISIINFDAFSFLDKVVLYADSLKEFFGRGNALCWGIVPTHEFDPKETAGNLLNKINLGLKALEKKGIDRKLLVENLLLSPSCGLGTVEESKAEMILRLLNETSALIEKSL